MKRNVSVKGTSGGITVEVVGKITTNGALMAGEVNAMADDLRDRLMQALPGLRYTAFRLSKIEVK
jgi:hypothetical protein